MQKLISIIQSPLILIFIIGLIFNNTASAGIFAGVNYVFAGNHYRCSATYSRGNSTNNTIKTKKNTTQFQNPLYYNYYNRCNKGAKNLAKKIKKWLKKDKNNILLNFDKPLKCKEGWIRTIETTWEQTYMPCDDKYQQQLLDLLTDKYPNQIKTTFIENETELESSSGISRSLEVNKRCMIEYTRFNLTTGRKTTHKNTTQSKDEEYHCKEGTKRLAKKLIKWTKRTYTNIISDIGVVRCKLENYDDGDPFEIFDTYSWGTYADCPAEYGQQLADDLIEKTPTQIGDRVRYYEFKPTVYD